MTHACLKVANVHTLIAECNIVLYLKEAHIRFFITIKNCSLPVKFCINLHT